MFQIIFQELEYDREAYFNIGKKEFVQMNNLNTVHKLMHICISYK